MTWAWPSSRLAPPPPLPCRRLSALQQVDVDQERPRRRDVDATSLRHQPLAPLGERARRGRPPKESQRHERRHPEHEPPARRGYGRRQRSSLSEHRSRVSSLRLDGQRTRLGQALLLGGNQLPVDRLLREAVSPLGHEHPSVTRVRTSQQQPCHGEALNHARDLKTLGGVAKKYRDVRRALRDAGWHIVRQRGSHEYWRSADGRRAVAVAGHDRQEVPAGTLASMRRQAGLEDLR
jgi:predicted RNA binding protein YcfA (HicA-like mRNA interferase family)